MQESIFVFALSMNPKSKLFALPEPWYTLVNVSLELPVGDDEGGDDGSEFLSRNSLGIVLLLSILLLIRTGPSSRYHDIHFVYLVH
jgi:hypothetical protein